jgi:hypothetical protein
VVRTVTVAADSRISLSSAVLAIYYDGRSGGSMRKIGTWSVGGLLLFTLALVIIGNSAESAPVDKPDDTKLVGERHAKDDAPAKTPTASEATPAPEPWVDINKLHPGADADPMACTNPSCVGRANGQFCKPAFYTCGCCLNQVCKHGC